MIEKNITLSGSYTFIEGTLSHTSQNVVLEFVEEDKSSENGLALYIQFPINYFWYYSFGFCYL